MPSVNGRELMHPVQLLNVVEVPYAICTPPIPESIAQEILRVTVVPDVVLALLFMVNDQLYGA